MGNKIILFFFFGIFFTLSNAQEVLLTREKYPEMRYLGMAGNIYYNENQQVKGSAFLNDNWTKGDVIFKNGTVIKDVNLKIDIFLHQIIIYHDILKRVLELDKGEINSFVLYEYDKVRKFERIDKNNSKASASDGIFVEILVEGKVSFYKVFYKEKILMSTPAKPYIYEFVDGKEYRLKVDGKDIRIKLRKHSLIKLFPEHKTELKQYIRKSHLKLRRENDFSKAAVFINESFK